MAALDTLLHTAHRRGLTVVSSAALLVGLSVAHALEDFAYGVPARFGVAIAPAAVIVGLGYLAHVAIIVLAARDKAVGYFGNFAIAITWLVAAALDHPKEVLFVAPYRAGLISKSLIIGLMLTALVSSIISLLAWKGVRKTGEYTSSRNTIR